jgi:hypothetical protein
MNIKQGQTFFSLVGNSNEKEKLFRDLCSSPCEVIAKAHESSSDVTLLKAEVYTGVEVSFRLLDPAFKFKETGELILQITLGGEKYLCSSPFHFRGNRIYIKTTGPLYHLQRRDDFRLKIPDSFKAHLNVATINNNDVTQSLKIFDLSGGGCRVSYSTKTGPLKTGDIVTGEILIAGRPSIQISAEVRHAIEDETQKTQSLGLSFTNISTVMKNRLSGLVMDLYRQFFSKIK